MKKILLLLMVGWLTYGWLQGVPDFLQSSPLAGETAEQQLLDAYRNRKSDLQVGGTGVVSRILADDRDGRRHQKFILRLSSGHTLLISHNIDLAPRIDGLREGDTVGFYGEYEWNPRGGVVHWTHHDPAGRHRDGWLTHRGVTYQ